MEKSNVSILHKIKWSVVLSTNNNIGLFAQTLEKLLASVDPKRTEIILLQNGENKLITEIFSTFCEKANVNYFYGDNYTHAAEIATGTYVVYLTDATLVSKNFLIKLTFCIENNDQEGKTVIVSPISNDSFPNLGITATNLDSVQAQISKQPKNTIPWTFTYNLSEFCLMVKKDYLLNNPFTTFRQLILKAVYNGYYVISANDTVVFHHPEQLQLEPFEDVQPVTKLAVCYRVKIDDEYLRDVFIKSLEKSLEFANNIYVLDDNSKVKTQIFLREKRPDLWERITKYEKFSQPFNEKRDYNDLISWAEADGCTWVLMLEGDEIVEDKVTRHYLNLLLNPVNPEILGYRISHYILWDNESQWRFDAPWGKMNDVRLTRVLPGRRITKEGQIAAQCGYSISLPLEAVRDSSIRVKNYGYIKPEYRVAKRNFFEKLGLKGINNFDHITSINGLHVHPWTEDSTLSIYTPTNKGGELLDKWLDYNGYFADQIVIGNDSNSLSEQDIKLCKQYNVILIPIVMGDDFGSARNVLLDQCTSKYILQLDIDERLEEYNSIRRMIDINQYDAWMFTIPNVQPDGGAIITETLRLFKNANNVRYWGRLHETIDNHVRKSGWKISKSPVRITHFGYTLQDPDTAYKKMQKYLEINLKQIKDTPHNGMSYYNVALHFIEDDLIDDAIKLLEICTIFQPNFALAGLELGKCYIRKAHQWVSKSTRILGDKHPMGQSFKPIEKALQNILPKHYIVAKGHCLGYFNQNPVEAKWLREHILKMEKTIEEIRTKKLEQLKNKSA